MAIACTENWDDPTSEGEDDDIPVSFAQLKEVNCHAENTRSLSFLPIVHERQAARMRTRSEWFLAPVQRPIYDIDIDDSNSGPSSSCDDRLLAVHAPTSFSRLEHSRGATSERSIPFADTSPLLRRTATNLPS